MSGGPFLGGADAGQGDPGPSHELAGGLQGDCHAGRGEVTDPALQLEVAARASALRRWYDGLDGDLVRLQQVLERAGDEIGDRDGAPAARSLRHHGAPEREYHRCPVTLRIGVT